MSQGPLFLFRIRLGSITLHINLKYKTKIVLNNLYSRFVLVFYNVTYVSEISWYEHSYFK